ncbi:mediator of DNA damage checkpoint protein 1 [Anopheles aquasalis]|uniref:mediator of DNA damage checkpoint protein 1 n=1 Tax=Anopheles aquasalis TaxID=42839 RepID=UPI00215A759E|nr:mediator of DNA damage checkpoint protein 1 [Anopheles aquasalis]
MRDQIRITTPRSKRHSVGVTVQASVTVHAPCDAKVTFHRSPATKTTGHSTVRQESGTPVAEAAAGANKRMSLHENLLMRILSTPSDQPLYDRGTPSESQRTTDDSFDSCLSRGGTPVPDLFDHSPDNQLRCNTPPALDGGAGHGPVNPQMQRLMRDLNSPSATARMRALRALKSPSKLKGYGAFDVPHEEQDIITADERVEPVQRTIQEVLRNVCVYVEVRSGTDNRSDGIKEHIASLGARVNERLLKDTTHVIFKDGLLSTYQKAKKMNIPVVSILWIEACKRHTCLMNPDDFKISNHDRYDNPDLYKRIRRQKSMQPGANVAAGTKKRTVTAGAIAKANAVLSPPTKLPTLHRIRKDDRLERILNEFEAENQFTGNGSSSEPIDEYDEMLQAAPKRMLERFRNTPTTSDSPAVAATRATNAGDDGEIDCTPTGVNGTDRSEDITLSRRVLFSAGRGASTKKDKPLTPASKARRKTILFTPQMANVEEEASNTRQETQETNKTPAQQQGTRNRRKTIVATVGDRSSNADVQTPVVAPPARTIRTRRSSMLASVEADVQTLTLEESSVAIPNEPTIRRDRRKTIAFGNDENTPPHAAVAAIGLSSKSRPSTKYNTIYSPKDMDISSVPKTAAISAAVSSSLGNALDHYQTESSSMNVSESEEVRRMSENSKPTSESIHNSTRMSIATTSGSVQSRRRTLFTPGGASDTFMEALEVSETPPSNSTLHTKTRPSSAFLLHGNGSSILHHPKPTSNSTPKEPAPKTLLEEYQSSLRFSSSRAPERRRQTIFDITMDIVDQRLSEINRRAALTAQRNSPEQSSSSSGPLVTPAQDAALRSPPPVQQTAISEYYRKATKSIEKINKPRELITSSSSSSSSSGNSASEAESVPGAEAQPRRRKLFNVQTQDMLFGTKPAAAKVATPKRRSLAPVQMDSKASVGVASAKKRRTTMLFQSPFEAAQTVTAKKQPFQPGRGLPSVVATQNSGSAGPRQYLATTNLHTEQSTFLKEAIGTLGGGFILEADVTANTTHLVTLESRRTINLLRALIRGLWIVRYDWIVASVTAGHWLPEEQFELRDFSPAIQANRSERQAFGKHYRSDLFADYGPIWISPRCNVPPGQLRELLVLCHAKVTGNRGEARYLIVEKDSAKDYRVNGQQICVDALWILDSITINKVKKLSLKYRIER